MIIDAGSAANVQMATVRGHPAIAYTIYPAAPGPLKYAQANDTTGAVWSAPLTLRGAGDYQSLSLIEVEGRPGIAYQDNGLAFTIPRQ